MLPTGPPGSTLCLRYKHGPRRSPPTSAERSQSLMPVAQPPLQLQHRLRPTSLHRAASSPPGMPRSPHALRPKMSKPSRALASEAGSGTPPVPATGTRSRCISPPCPLRLARCCCPKLGRTPPVASRSAPHTKQSPSPRQSFGCSCFAACACHCHSPRESVHAAGRLTRSVTIEQHVPTPVPWLPAPFLLSELAPGSARRLGHESPATCALPT